MAKRKKSLRQQRYELNKKAKVGEQISCTVCETVFIKKQWQQVFCCPECKDKYWNNKKDRHRAGYHHQYNIDHPERLERIGIYKDSDGKFGHYDEDGNFYTFEEEETWANECENPQLGI